MMNTSRCSSWIFIAVLLIVYILDRILICAGGSALLFSINEAEYGHYRALLSYWDSDGPFGSQWNSFLIEARSIGNQPHGSLGYSALFLLTVQHIFSLSMSTFLLKFAALAHSTLGLFGWLLLLRKEQLSRPGLIAFTILFICASPEVVKMSILYWGSHDMAIAFLPWLLLSFSFSMHSTTYWKYPFIGAVSALGLLFQLSLAPIILLYYSIFLVQNRSQKTAILLSLLCFGILWQGLLASSVLSGLALPNPLNFKSDLSLNPNFQLLSFPSSLMWGHDVKLGKQGLFVLVALFLYSMKFSKSEEEKKLLLLVPFAVITVDFLSNSLTVLNQPPMGPSPRFFALYYAPMIAGVILCTRHSKIISLTMAALAIWAAINHGSFFNLYRPTMAKDFDGVALYFHQRGEAIPQNLGLKYADKGQDFLLGYSFVTSFHSNDYWVYWPPSLYIDLPIQALLTKHVQTKRKGATNIEDFRRGTLAALDLFVSPDETVRRKKILSHIEFYR